MKKVVVLGSTGSIGQQTLEVIRRFPQNFQVLGLAGHQNTRLLLSQINEFKPKYVTDPKACLSDASNSISLSLEEMACLPEADIVLMAISGTAGLKPTLAAVRAGKTVALANKESLVMAGELIMREASQHRARILPVDSEHSAIWQCLEGEKSPFNKLILTASGGPFRGCTPTQLEQVTPEQALKHPNWQMGPKITIDSATLLNKGLEIIEAHWLFKAEYADIEVVIHPESIIHSMVQFADGAVKAQLSRPDMRLPIQYALTYPERLPNPDLVPIDWQQLASLTFEKPAYASFPCLKLATDAGKAGGTTPAVMCTAGEAAVLHFLKGQLKFSQIPYLMQKVLDVHKPAAATSIDAIMDSVEEAKRQSAKVARELLC